ncbi:hypothetical protein [Streptomyces beihaiensis]|uniref:Uncharacterized protein n=1 Tax=Streptomyces beihaiensis TaxID=2984495 RepID=A0ABT3TZ75_9ACTN|nr:hypothetical protein [Streptomyces beihaiensis]MCX3062346.1 hypothetical protein [Streptomyces beihaiensis]
MGFAVLYVAFGLVALWLLGEVLFQYKARLRWRVLALVGFLGVVVGVVLPSVYVIGLGAIAFAVGQTYVTLSFRRGFAAGWALKAGPLGRIGRDEGGRDERRRPARQDPTLEVSDVEYEQDPAPDLGADGDLTADPAAAYAQTSEYAQASEYAQTSEYAQASEYAQTSEYARTSEYGQTPETSAESTAVYAATEPMPDDTGGYGVYSDSAYDTAAQAQPAQAHAYDQAAYGYDQQNYGYDAAQQPYAAPYSDPYIGTQTYPAQPEYGDPYGTGQQYADPYAAAAGYGADTPPGGVWVPHQRTGDDQQPYGGELPPEQTYPYQQDPNAGTGYGNGYDEQQQYWR